MNLVRSTYRWLDVRQRTRWFHISASILAIAFCAAAFGTLIYQTTSINRQQQALTAALAGQNIQAGDTHALTLRDEGIVRLNGRTYGDKQLASRPELIFDQTGTINRPHDLAGVLVRDQYPEWAPKWLVEQPGTTRLLAAIALIWLLLIVWMDITVPFLLTLGGTALAVAIARSFGFDDAAFGLTGIGILTFSFVLLTRVAQVLLNRPNQLCAVAHTVLKEASRTKIPLIFIVIILVMLPLIPLALDPATPLRFRMQTFISRSMGFTFYLAACMTLFLACATVAFEIRDRQIWQIMTKPVSRFSYLLGKWLGVVVLNLIILMIAAVSIFTYIQYLRMEPVARGLQGAEDRMQVRDAILTARVGISPDYQELTEEQMRERIDDVIRRTPELAARDELSLNDRRKLREDLKAAFSAAQRSVPPEGGARQYVFSGLKEAKELQSTLTLRYRFYIMSNDEHETFPAAFVFNDDPALVQRSEYVPTISHVLSIPSSLIRDDGTLSITIVNLYSPPPEKRGRGAMNFEAADFELLYKVDAFEANFVRAVIIDWIKLSFLAMLGISCATFLSFSVACLTAFTVFLAATLGPFLAVSLREYYPPMTSSVDWSDLGMVLVWAFKSVIRFIAQALVFLLQAFGEYRPAQALVEGRMIPWSSVLLGLLKVGIIWSGFAMLVGAVVMRKRQLAIYSGQG